MSALYDRTKTKQQHADDICLLLVKSGHILRWIDW